MKNYSKTHTNKLAADTHLAKIKKRGGKATVKEEQGRIQIDYYFPEKTATGKTKPKAKKYDIISPDGITIRIGDQNVFRSMKEAKAYFEQWKKRFEHQGYYSSNGGRIPLDYLEEECRLLEI